MSEVALLLLQVSTSITPPPNAAEILLHPVPEAHCRPSPNEITVCARNPNAYRLPLRGPAADEEPPLPKAEWRMFGASALGVHGVERNVGGVSAPAAMMTLKIPF